MRILLLLGLPPALLILLPANVIGATPLVREAVDTSLALDVQSDPRIGYFAAGTGDLRYAAKTGGSWTIEDVDTTVDVGAFSSLALDAQGNPQAGVRRHLLPAIRQRGPRPQSQGGSGPPTSVSPDSHR